MTLFQNSMRSLLTRSTILVGALTLFPACGTTSDADDGEASTTDTGGDGDADTTAEAGDGDSTTATGDGDGDTTSGDGDADTTTTGDGDGDTDECMMDVPDGGSCTEDCECMSEQCFVVPVLGGLCGECTEDADCPDGGCSIPNPLQGVGSACNDGSLGGGCEDDSVCMDGLTCQLVLDVSGILTASTCSECGTDSDCTEGENTLCTPQYDVENFTGQKVCVAPGTVPNAEGCDLEGTGAMACESGVCNDVDIMGLVSLGICGDCASDDDCAMGETCTPANVDITTGDVTASSCG